MSPIQDTQPITTAMVLAAGKGERMRPLTDRLPKPLIEVAGRALIDHLLDNLVQIGIKTAVINAHHLAPLLDDHVKRRAASGVPPHLVLSDESERLLDTGGGIVKALPLLGDRPFLAANADTLWCPGMGDPPRPLVESWDPVRMDALLLVAPTVTTTGYDGIGDFTMEADGLLVWRGEGRVAPFVHAGAAIMKPESFHNVPDGPFSNALIWRRLATEHRLYGVRLDGRFLHVGTVAAIAEAEAALAKRD